MEQDEELDEVCIVFLSSLMLAAASGSLLPDFSIRFDWLMGEEWH